jgi:ribonuclease HI
MLVTVIADASYDHGTRAGGFGYWAVSQRKRQSGGGPFKSLSRNNNVAEMMALMNGVHMAFVHGVAFPGDAILAQTDCTAAILAFEGKRVLMNDEKILVEGLQTLLKLKGATIRFKHVKGHTNGAEPRLWVNNACDAVAKRGMHAARDRARTERMPLLSEVPTPPKPVKSPEQRAEKRAQKQVIRKQDQQNRRTFAFNQKEWESYVLDPELSSIPPWAEQELPEQRVAGNDLVGAHAA